MPIIKSAAKRVRQAEKSRARNVQSRRFVRDSVRALEAAIETKNTKEASKLLSDVYKAFDKAVKKNLIHKNKAARKKAHYSAAVREIMPAKKASTKKKSAPKSPSKK